MSKLIEKFSITGQISGYQPHVDGIRAIAVLAVLIYHAWPTWLPGGFTGVDIFFVISGYLITGRLISKPIFTRKDLLNFWIRRIRRIFPALIFMLSITFLLGWVLYNPFDFMNLGYGIFAGGISAANLVFLAGSGGYFDNSEQIQPMLHLWSLGIEEQFYLLLPVLVYIIKPANKNLIGRVLLIFAVSSFLLGVYLTDWNPTFAFFFPFSRFWELLVGAGLFWITNRKIEKEPASIKAITGILGIGLILLSLILVTDISAFPGALALLPTFGAAALIYAGGTFKPLSILLKFKPLVYLGTISYSLYLWHWVTLTIPENVIGRPLDDTEKIIAITAALVMATISTFLIEKPLRFRETKKSRVLTAPAAMSLIMLTIAGLGLTVFWSNGSQAIGAFSPQGTKGSDTSQIRKFLTDVPNFDWFANVRLDTCYLQGNFQWAPECIQPGRKTIVLWGDSHAASLYPGFREVFTPEGFQISQLTVAGCPPIQGLGSQYKSDCSELQEIAIEELAQLQPKVLIIHAAWKHDDYPYGRNNLIYTFVAQLKVLVKNLPNTEILVLGPVPRWEGSPQSVSYESWVGSEEKEQPPSSFQPATQLRNWDTSLETVAKIERVNFISMNEILCPDQLICLAHVGLTPEQFTFEPAGHLSKAGATFSAEKIMAMLRVSQRTLFFSNFE